MWVLEIQTGLYVVRALALDVTSSWSGPQALGEPLILLTLSVFCSSLVSVAMVKQWPRTNWGEQALFA